MTSIASIVRDYFEQRPFLQEALSKGLLNNAATAETLIPEIERALQQKVKFSAVNMAIRRLGETLERELQFRKIFNADADITIKSSLLELTVAADEMAVQIEKVHAIIKPKKGEFLTITAGIHEMMIITSIKHEKELLRIFPKTAIKKIIKNLSGLSITIPEDSIDNVGILYTVSRGFAWHNINIIDIVSTFTEMTVIVREDDTARSFEALRELIRRNS